jgi:hypothetical protein
VTDWPTELARREAETAGDSEAFDRVLIGGAVAAPARIRPKFPALRAARRTLHPHVEGLVGAILAGVGFVLIALGYLGVL